MDKKLTSSINLRWSPYILLHGNELKVFLNEHFVPDKKKVLFIMGKGFDIRMNIGIKRIVQANPSVDIDLFLINFNEGKKSNSLKYNDLVIENEKELLSIITGNKIINKNIDLWKGGSRHKRRVGGREAANLINNFSDIEKYSEIVVDISALPRGVYFSLIGKILSLIDNKKDIKINFFIFTAENAEIDSNIIEKELDEELHSPFGFNGGINLESSNSPNVWLPLIGEDKNLHLNRSNLQIRPDEICPLLPFPSKNPRRSDDIFRDHFEFFEILQIGSQNIIYVPEQNPFEVYKKLVSTINKYNESLSLLGGCNAIITVLTSKLLSIGVLLAAYELKNKKDFNVGIWNIDSQGYEIKDVDKMKNLKEKSELFVTWLCGKPYN